jgi:hypothetical protein
LYQYRQTERAYFTFTIYATYLWDKTLEGFFVRQPAHCCDVGLSLGCRDDYLSLSSVASLRRTDRCLLDRNFRRKLLFR